ncbi:MAG: hypothetical protein KIT72_04775 [Polyangiaceae bacterium]|nr:hypothetical protein [Polyangiaceae bacterium]MCW5789718.1 hypothetical protein [Polyangiaceae bacterium]
MASTQEPCDCGDDDREGSAQAEDDCADGSCVYDAPADDCADGSCVYEARADDCADGSCVYEARAEGDCASDDCADDAQADCTGDGCEGSALASSADEGCVDDCGDEGCGEEGKGCCSGPCQNCVCCSHPTAVAVTPWVVPIRWTLIELPELLPEDRASAGYASPPFRPPMS